MIKTPFLELAFLSAAQAQKHVTVNEALVRVDLFTNIAVERLDVASPPVAIEGQRFHISFNPTGEWSGKENQIAAFYNGSWWFFTPKPGQLILNLETDRLMCLSKHGTWFVIAGGPTQEVAQ